MNTLHQYEQGLARLVSKHSQLLVLTAETRFNMRGLEAVIEDRFLDVGIAEQTLIGSAAGLSARGYYPVCHALASFLLFRPYEFIRTDLGISRAGAALVGSFAGLDSQANGPTHQAIEDISLMKLIPGMRVAAPHSYEDLLEVLDSSCSARELIYTRFPQNCPSSPPVESLTSDPVSVVLPGDGDTLVLSYGRVFFEALEACQSMKQDGWSGTLGYVRQLWPLPEAELLSLMEGASRVLVVEDHRSMGGLGESLQQLAYRHLGETPPIELCNLGEGFFQSGMYPDILEASGMSAHRIASRLTKTPNEH
jgi:transketolase